MRQRVDELKQAAVRLEGWAKNYIYDGIELVLCLERLDTLVTSYFYDITRYKHFHGMLDDGSEANVNFQKVYSYTAKWIIREKPIYVLIDDLRALQEHSPEKAQQYIEFATTVNEAWLIAWIESSYFCQSGKDLCLAENNNDRDGLLYSLKYRDFSVAWFEEWLNEKILHA